MEDPTSCPEQRKKALVGLGRGLVEMFINNLDEAFVIVIDMDFKEFTEAIE